MTFNTNIYRSKQQLLSFSLKYDSINHLGGAVQLCHDVSVLHMNEAVKHALL